MDTFDNAFSDLVSSEQVNICSNAGSKVVIDCGANIIIRMRNTQMAYDPNVSRLSGLAGIPGNTLAMCRIYRDRSPFSR